MSSSPRLSRSSMIAKQKQGRQATHRRRSRPQRQRRSGIAIFNAQAVRQMPFTQRRPCCIAGKLQGLNFLGACSIQKKGLDCSRRPTGQYDRHRDAPLRPNHNREIGYRDEFTISLGRSSDGIGRGLPVREIRGDQSLEAHASY